MAGRAERLPVRAIPEHPVIATMGLDVVDHGRGLTAHDAVGMHQQELSTGLAPPVIVTTLSSSRTGRIMTTIAGAGAGYLTGAALAVGNNTATGADMGRAWHASGSQLVKRCAVKGRVVAQLFDLAQALWRVFFAFSLSTSPAIHGDHHRDLAL